MDELANRKKTKEPDHCKSCLHGYYNCWVKSVYRNNPKHCPDFRVITKEEINFLFRDEF